MSYGSFKHIVITRFNLVVKNKNDVISNVWTRDKNNHLIQTEKWLQTRFSLFELFCLPSILNQSNLNFVWMVYFDSNTPEKYKEIVRNWEVTYKVFLAVYKDSYDDFMNELSADIEKISEGHNFIITTRLDNDDSLHKDAIDIIQKNFVPIHNTPINLLVGHCISVKRNIIEVATLFKSEDGPFVSIIENKDNIATVYAIRHTDYVDNPAIIQVSDEPLWLQVIHENNMLNFTRGRVHRVKNYVDNYGISGAQVSYSIAKEILQQSWYVLRKIFPPKIRKLVFEFIKGVKIG